MSLSQKITDARKIKGLTQEELADLTKITVRTIQRIESGESIPRAYTLKAIAKALHLEFEDVYTDNAENKAPIDVNEQKHFLQIICLSCFSFIVIPFIHFLIPFLILKKQKNPDKLINQYANQIIRDQMYWVVFLNLLLLLTLIFNFLVGIVFHKSIYLHYLIPVFAMYLINAIIIFKSLLKIKNSQFLLSEGIKV